MSYNSSLYDEYSDIAKKLVIVIDTSEKDNPRYRNRVAAFECMGLTVERKKLVCGDYSAKLELPNGDIVDLTKSFCIERKMDTKELLQCFGVERARFENELKRAKNMGCELHVVTESGCYSDLLNPDENSHVTALQAISTYHLFQQRYNIKYEWVTPDTFPTYVHQAMRFALISYLLSHYPSGECLWEQDENINI